jgi:hypothetical protein
MVSRRRLLEMRVGELVVVDRLGDPNGEAESISIHVPKVLERPGTGQGEFEFPKTEIDIQFRREQHD